MKKQKIFIAFLAVLFFGLFLHSNVNASELEPSVLKDDISRIEMTGSESMENKNSLKNSGEIEQEIDEILDHGKITEPISTDENPTETTNEEPPILEETETTNEEPPILEETESTNDEPPILEETESTNDEPPILEETETTNDEPSVLEESIPTKKEVVEKNQSLVEGVNIIDGIPYVYDVNGKLVRSKWYTTSTGRKTYADKNGITHINDVWALSDGNYVFGKEGYLIYNDWLKTDDGKQAFAAPKTGKAYSKGSFTVSDGIRYVFDANGYILKNNWQYEPGYGWSYGRPQDGAAYSQGAYTLNDGIRYAFDNYGYLAVNRWIYEPGYGYAFGKPSAGKNDRGGAVYKQGAFTVNDGVRYAFDNYGYLAVNRWIYEPGYGYAFGRPSMGKNDSGGAAYRQGAYTLNDGIRYAFDNYGYLAVNRWIYEPGYGYAFGRPSMGRNDRGGAVYRQGAFTVNDGTRYTFNKYGYKADDSWVFEPGYGWTYGEKGTGKTFHNKNVLINGRNYYFNSIGYWGDTVNLSNSNSYKFSIVQNKVYLNDSNSNRIMQNFKYKGKLYHVNPVHGYLSVEDGWYDLGTKYVYLSSGELGSEIHEMLSNGIDISYYQDPSEIDYNKLANNIEFAILRAGYTGQSTGTSMYQDTAFNKHYAEFSQRGIPLGVYWYSCANTKAQAIAEAKKCLQIMQGKSFKYPIYIDIEDPYHHENENSKTLTDVAIAFCETIKEAGYTAGIYSSSWWYANKFEFERLDPYEIWVANWSYEPSIRKGMWQYSSQGRVDGYDGDLDMNYAYVHYPSIT